MAKSGIIYVFDLARPSTYLNIIADIEYLKKMIPDGVIKLVANKKDLVTDEQIEQIAKKINIPIDAITSAKTGENVENLFLQLGKDLI
jgi:50S ribosomal subunit-associated GTPase HflX